MFESHVAKRIIPMISTTLPTVACTMVNRARFVVSFFNWAIMPVLSRDGIMMAPIEIVCNASPPPISAACFTMPCLSLAIIAKPRMTRMTA